MNYQKINTSTINNQRSCAHRYKQIIKELNTQVLEEFKHTDCTQISSNCRQMNNIRNLTATLIRNEDKSNHDKQTQICVKKYAEF